MSLWGRNRGKKKEDLRTEADTFIYTRAYAHTHTHHFFSVYSVMDESLLMLAIDKLQVIYPSVSKSTVLLLLTAIIQKVTLKELQ